MSAPASSLAGEAFPVVAATMGEGLVDNPNAILLRPVEDHSLVLHPGPHVCFVPLLVERVVESLPHSKSTLRHRVPKEGLCLRTAKHCAVAAV